jgi:hypothetical protein
MWHKFKLRVRVRNNRTQFYRSKLFEKQEFANDLLMSRVLHFGQSGLTNAHSFWYKIGHGILPGLRPLHSTTLYTHPIFRLLHISSARRKLNFDRRSLSNADKLQCSMLSVNRANPRVRRLGLLLISPAKLSARHRPLPWLRRRETAPSPSRGFYLVSLCMFILYL